jgi:hypothetical protein
MSLTIGHTREWMSPLHRSANRLNASGAPVPGGSDHRARLADDRGMTEREQAVVQAGAVEAVLVKRAPQRVEGGPWIRGESVIADADQAVGRQGDDALAERDPEPGVVLPAIPGPGEPPQAQDVAGVVPEHEDEERARRIVGEPGRHLKVPRRVVEVPVATAAFREALGESARVRPGLRQVVRVVVSGYPLDDRGRPNARRRTRRIRRG